MTILNETLHERKAARSSVTFAHRMFGAVFCNYFLVRILANMEVLIVKFQNFRA